MKILSLIVSAALVLAFAQLHAAEKNTFTGTSADTRMPDSYVRLTGQETYFWAWPMMNIHNRRMMLKDLPDAGLMGGTVPVAPPNKMAMLTDYISPNQRMVACPNQDVVYGFGLLALDQSPVVVQVPNFGKRYWVYQLVDNRTDSFAKMGSMYGTKPGAYLIVGPKWNGKTPKGITKVFHSTTNTAVFIPRIFQDDTPEDKEAIQRSLRGVTMYPVAEYDGKMKTKEWGRLPQIPPSAGGETGEKETAWVAPEKFFDDLAAVLDAVPPLPGEEGRYAQIRNLLQAASKDPHIKEVLKQAAIDAEIDLLTPVFQFHNFGKPVAYHWTTISNGADFGKDYFTRTAAAKANIFVNAEKETKYFYQDLDVEGLRLNGKNSYTLTFPKGQTPPVNGFWSVTLYNENHFFAPNELNRYSLGTKSKNLKYGADGSLTLYVQATAPSEENRTNWLPAPRNADFSLYVRAYSPKESILSGKWTPPPVIKVPQAGKVTQAY